MFLKLLQKDNQKLIDYTLNQHAKGKLLPDTYVIDVDRLLQNAKLLKEEADRCQVELFFMLKQIGRNPYIAKKLVEMGYPGAVVVDFKEACVMMDNHIPICNIGHLVQIPDHLISRVLAYGVDYITVYSLEKIQRIHEEAQKLGITQKIMLRVFDEGDMVYESQKGGFPLHQLQDTLETIKQYPSLDVCGITTFPCFLRNEDNGQLEPTHNVLTLQKAQDIFRQAGIDKVAVNMPSATCFQTIEKIHEYGGTQGEPGHALTGTTPLHCDGRQQEKSALLYLTEVSHQFDGKSYAFGGGLYRRGHLQHALVNNQVIPVNENAMDSIDYHFELEASHLKSGAAVIMSFRTQIFVTRSDVALVEGLSAGRPTLQGIYDAFGRKKD